MGKRGETIFLLFVQISWNNLLEATWKTLLETDLDLLLHFKPNLTGLGLA